jgi:hypothetical protein
MVEHGTGGELRALEIILEEILGYRRNKNLVLFLSGSALARMCKADLIEQGWLDVR